MTEKNIRAEDLMKHTFLRMGATHTLSEALAILLDPNSRREGPRLLIILNPDGGFAGALSARDLLKALVPDWVHEESEEGNEAMFERRLLSDIQDKLSLKVSEAMNRDTPTASPDDSLPVLVEYMQDRRLESLPVLEGGRVRGVVHLVDVFGAAARLALAAQTEGA